ncbi:MAG TPA: methylated-DNA--[protein]-cysteine S-methyltransferase [Gemmatimonadales bacterium]
MLETIAAAPAASLIGYTIVDSPLGRLLLGATARGLCTVRLGDSDEELETGLRAEHPDAELRRDGEPLARWANALLRHLAGQEPRVDLPLDLRASAFQRRVWTALRAIPYGATRSYREIAEAIGRPDAVRAVARACATNPVALAIPCHRVIRHDGDPGGYRWGVRRKRMLLEQERAVLELAEREVVRQFVDQVGPPLPAAGQAAGVAREMLAERYEILRPLGAGGMGVVYAARDRELDDVIALKALRAPAGTEDQAALDRFRSELRITRRISHPHVVRTHDIGRAGDRRFITMEYVHGWSLAQLLERGPMPVPVALVLGRQLCRALAVVHAQGVIHRDIKPQNVLVSRDGDVKLADFGIAELASRVAAAQPDAAPRGTLPYMAPEQLLGEPLDTGTDVYGTAAVLYECLAGRPPYPQASPDSLVAQALLGGPPSPRALAPAVPRPLADLLLAALAADHAARPASATAFHDALAQIDLAV